ncbi:MAG: hypothetical protein B1H03_04960 [Planctomycetales bacterium 4484_113]|nr:MAG: hypothetical protein B1H03_04960 [Planctomycetales bacterium 4484_113]
MVEGGDEPVKRALLLGYFGAGNWGDELILECFLRGYGDILREKGFELAVTVKRPANAAYREHLGELWPGLDLVQMGPLLPCSLGLRKSSHLICPGGSLLQNRTSNRSLGYYLSIISAFLRGGRAAMMLNQGLGPIRGELWEARTREVLSQLQFFSARDRRSAMWAAESVPSDRRLLTSDAVFAALPDWEYEPAGGESWDYCFVVRAQVGSPLLSSPQFPPDGRYLVAVLQEDEWKQPRRIEHLGRRLDRESLALLNASSFVRKLRQCKLVVSERYHGLVAALIAGVPFVGVGDDPKLSSFCGECDMPACTERSVSVGTLEKLKKEALERFRAEVFRERVADFVDRHRRQRERLIELL